MNENNLPVIDIHINGEMYGSSIKINGIEMPMVRNITVCAEVGEPTLVAIEMYGIVNVTGNSGVMLTVDTPQTDTCSYCCVALLPVDTIIVTRLDGNEHRPVCKRCAEVLLKDGWIKL